MVSRGAQKESISIEIQYRMPITGKERLVTYALEIGIVESKVCVKREILRYKRGQHGSPFHFLDFTNGSGEAVTNEEDFDKTDEDLNKEEQTLESKDILAIKVRAVSTFQGCGTQESYQNWHIGFPHQYGSRSKEATGEITIYPPRATICNW